MEYPLVLFLTLDQSNFLTHVKEKSRPQYPQYFLIEEILKLVPLGLQGVNGMVYQVAAVPIT